MAHTISVFLRQAPKNHNISSRPRATPPNPANAKTNPRTAEVQGRTTPGRTLGRPTTDAWTPGQTREKKAPVRQAVLTTYEAAAAKNGVANDVAAALAFYLAAHYSAYHDGREVAEPSVNALVAQLHTARWTLTPCAPPSERRQEDQMSSGADGRLYRHHAATGASRSDAAPAKDRVATGREWAKVGSHVEPGRWVSRPWFDHRAGTG